MNPTDDKQFEPMLEMDGIIAKNDTSIGTVHEQVVARLIEAKMVPENCSPKRIRLREKIGKNPGKLLRPFRTFGESTVYLYDNKAISIQILDEEEDLPNDDVGSVCVTVQRWLRQTWTLGERFEIYLPGSMSIRDIARTLGSMTDIPVDNMKAMVVPRDTEFLLCDLPQKSPPRNYGRSWFEPGNEKGMLRYMSHSMRLQDGDLLLVQDSSEPLRELTQGDLKSMAIVEAATQNSYGVYTTYSYPTVTPHSATMRYGTGVSSSDYLNAANKISSSIAGGGLSGSSSSYAKRSGGGIHIKTHKERLEEEQNKLNNAASASASPSDIVDKDSTTGEGETDNSSNVAAVAAAVEEEMAAYYNSTDNQIAGDDAEFQKQGGMALFDDLLD